MLYEDAVQTNLKQADQVYQDVTKARINQNTEIPIECRIEYATWPETLLYFSSLTKDASYATEPVKEMYQHTFRKYVEEWKEDAPGEFPSPLDENPELTDYQENRVGDLRFGIKMDRDRYFVETQYDNLDIENVPKSFWTSVEEESNDECVDAYSQSAINEYLN